MRLRRCLALTTIYVVALIPGLAACSNEDRRDDTQSAVADGARAGSSDSAEPDASRENEGGGDCNYYDANPDIDTAIADYREYRTEFLAIGGGYTRDEAAGRAEGELHFYGYLEDGTGQTPARDMLLAMPSGAAREFTMTYCLTMLDEWLEILDEINTSSLPGITSEQHQLMRSSPIYSLTEALASCYARRTFGPQTALPDDILPDGIKQRVHELDATYNRLFERTICPA